ncbi:MAG: hypothetical protein HYT79_09375 [Elusimicrobia bacterium]|nr:hypothetical protein [Elusimicrobiota bacterium]
MNKVLLGAFAGIVLIFGLGPSDAQDSPQVEVVEPAAGAEEFIRIEARGDFQRVIDPATLPQRSRLRLRARTGRSAQRTVRVATNKRAGSKIRLERTPPGVNTRRSRQGTSKGGRLRRLHERRSGR